MGGFGFGVGDLGDALGSIAQDIALELDQILIDIINTIIAALNYVWAVLVSVANFLYNALLALVDHLKTVIQWIYNNVLTQLVSWVKTAFAKLHALLRPVIDVLHKIKALQDWYYQNILKPILNLIQRIRGVLLIFRLLHFKVAGQLDAYLAQQESKIVTAFLTVQRDLNSLINWVNLIVDPFGNIYANVFLNAAITSINNLWALLWGAQNGMLTSPQQQQQTTAAQWGTRSGTITGVQLRASAGLTPDDTAIQEDAAAAFSALGYSARI